LSNSKPQLPLPHNQHLTQSRQIEAQPRTSVSRAQSAYTMYIFSNLYCRTLRPLQPYFWGRTRSPGFGVQRVHSSLDFPARSSSGGTRRTKHSRETRTVRRNSRKTSSHQSRHVHSMYSSPNLTSPQSSKLLPSSSRASSKTSAYSFRKHSRSYLRTTLLAPFSTTTLSKPRRTYCRSTSMRRRCYWTTFT
jgi:hypothetical protein